MFRYKTGGGVTGGPACRPPLTEAREAAKGRGGVFNTGAHLSVPGEPQQWSMESAHTTKHRWLTTHVSSRFRDQEDRVNQDRATERLGQSRA